MSNKTGDVLFTQPNTYRYKFRSGKVVYGGRSTLVNESEFAEVKGNPNFKVLRAVEVKSSTPVSTPAENVIRDIPGGVGAKGNKDKKKDWKKGIIEKGK